MKIQKVCEQVTTSNIYKRLTDDKTCAIISACTGESPEQDDINMTRLKAEIRKLKLGFNQFKSRWVHAGEAFDEWALLIPDITYRQAMKLAQMFNQKTIIFKDSESCREICVCPFIEGSTTFSTDDTVRTYNNEGTHVLNVDEAESIFKNKISGAASMPVKGSNKKPFTLTKEGLEIFEMFDPKPSMFETNYTYQKIYYKED